MRPRLVFFNVRPQAENLKWQFRDGNFPLQFWSQAYRSISLRTSIKALKSSLRAKKHLYFYYNKLISQKVTAIHALFLRVYSHGSTLFTVRWLIKDAGFHLSAFLFPGNILYIVSARKCAAFRRFGKERIAQISCLFNWIAISVLRCL